jgi:hypothetical protein
LNWNLTKANIVSSVNSINILLRIFAVDVPNEVVRARMTDKRCHRRHPHPSLWIDGIDEFFRLPSKVSDSVAMVTTRSLYRSTQIKRIVDAGGLHSRLLGYYRSDCDDVSSHFQHEPVASNSSCSDADSKIGEVATTSERVLALAAWSGYDALFCTSRVAESWLKCDAEDIMVLVFRERLERNWRRSLI